MGRKNKAYSKTLHQQAYDRLTSMQAFGTSKKEAKAAGTDGDKIFSFNTYQTYWKHTKYFLGYIKEHHPECTTLRSAKKYANEWLQSRADAGLSAWTVQTEAKALGKLYGIKPSDPDYFNPPTRHRVEIKRSRGAAARDRHFSEKNNAELVAFCRGTGLRRSELQELRGADLVTKDQIEARIAVLETQDPSSNELSVLRDTRYFSEITHFARVRNGKGGRSRMAPIVGKDAGRIVARMEATPAEKKVWEHVSSNADIHGYRSDYATSLYKAYARDINEIPYDRVHKGTGHRYQSGVYNCRKDEVGKKLDKAAMFLCSKALGHNRVEVVASNYLRGL